MNQKKGNYIRDDEQNNISHYGEFVPSYFSWVTQEEQKDRAEKLSDMTDLKKKKRKKKKE